MAHYQYKPKVIKAWAFYDWANSVYSLVISTAIFPIYYNSVTTVNGSDQIEFLGATFTNTSLYSYALSTSFFLVALMSPLLSGVADFSGRKKSFLRRFCYVGALSCGALFFFDDVDMIWLALLASILASVGFWGSQVFYNAYLPEIAPRRLQDKVSARGYSLGYLGSSLLLILCLALIEGHSFIGLEKSFATRLSFLLVGAWWALFAQITFRNLPEPKERKSIKWRTLTNGYRELRKFWVQLKKLGVLRKYLVAFFFFSMGVQTVILLASVFGQKALGLSTLQLISTILIIQFLGILGAVLFSKISEKIGNFKGLVLAIIIWLGICGAAFLLQRSDPHVAIKFYILGGTVGLVMGGIQSLARSTYSKMLPEKGEHTTYFSFFDVTEKMAIVLGTFAYGFIEQMTGDMHYSALTLGVFFLLALLAMFYLKSSERISM
ncbi:MFS transporter [Salibacter sp.]|uniref:MFS transporter n=1 Tax=Salibacter sp. TaxID=2010995 RepID=UPI0028705F7F|nr:MFS transporter [Salibacter sp.]